MTEVVWASADSAVLAQEEFHKSEALLVGSPFIYNEARRAVHVPEEPHFFGKNRNVIQCNGAKIETSINSQENTSQRRGSLISFIGANPPHCVGCSVMDMGARIHTFTHPPRTCR